MWNYCNFLSITNEISLWSSEWIICVGQWIKITVNLWKWSEIQKVDNIIFFIINSDIFLKLVHKYIFFMIYWESFHKSKLSHSNIDCCILVMVKYRFTFKFNGCVDAMYHKQYSSSMFIYLLSSQTQFSFNLELQ